MPPTNMEKLDVIGQYRFYLSILKAFNADDSHHCESWRAWLERRTTFLYTTVFFAGESLCTMLGIWGLCDHELVLREAASVAPVIITNLQVLPSYISLAWQNRKISRVLDGAQALINARCKLSAASRAIYHRAEKKYALITNTMFTLAKWAPLPIFAASAMFPLSYAIFNFPPPELWTLPLKLHALINHDKYSRYFADWTLELVCIIAYFAFLIANAALFAWFHLFIVAMADDLEAQLKETGKQITNPLAKIGGLKKMDIIASGFKEAIRFHINILELATAMNDIMEVALFCMLLACSIITAFNFFALDSNDLFSMQAASAIYDLCIVLATTSIYCYLSERVTITLYAIQDAFYESPWYELPVKLQTPMLLPIQRAALEFRLKSLGLIECSLPTFLSIIRTAGSYFLIMRSFRRAT